MSSTGLVRVLWVLLAFAAIAAGCSNNATPATSGSALSSWQMPPGKVTPDTGKTPAAEDDAVVADDDAVLPGEDAAAPDDDALAADDAPAIDDDATPAGGDTQTAPDVKGTQNDAGTSPDVKVKPKCQDDDGDGYGENCDAGVDCDDYNPYFNISCPNCSKGNYAGCACKGKSAPCYAGDPATAGVGICQAGVQACKDGFWGACVGEVSAGIETCNGKDDDCDGQIDEGVKSSCGGCDLSCVQKAVGQGTENTFALNSENSSGVGLDPTGAIVIESGQISLSLKFLWASNSPENTVSKVDCKTAKEVGRYKLVFNGVPCTDPSRTTVDLDGNVWVGCRGGGKVTKIIAEKKNCTDKNGNGTIETSEDINGDGSIQPNEMVNEDECIAWQTPVLGSTTRAAGVDKFNNAWFGFYGNKYLKRLNSKDGAVLETVNIPCASYGLVIDQKGVIWIQGSGCGLVSYDPVSKAMNKYNPPGWNYSSYGINVDGKGRIWLGGSNNGSGAASFDPKNGQWVSCKGVPSSAGIATANDGFVYPAHDCYGGGGSIGKVDGDKCWATNGAAGSYIGYMPTGTSGQHCPHGVAVDFDGYVWGVNWTGNSVGKVNPKQNFVNGVATEAPVVRTIGQSPYTYSDMTGYTLNYFTAPKGLFTTTFFAGGGGNPVSSTKAKAVWQAIDMTADFKPTTKIHIRFRAADTKDLLEAANWIEAGDFKAQAELPFDLTKVPSAPVIGTMLQVELNLITDDKKVSPAVKSLGAKAKLQ